MINLGILSKSNCRAHLWSHQPSFLLRAYICAYCECWFAGMCTSVQGVEQADWRWDRESRLRDAYSTSPRIGKRLKVRWARLPETVLALYNFWIWNSWNDATDFVSLSKALTEAPRRSMYHQIFWCIGRLCRLSVSLKGVLVPPCIFRVNGLLPQPMNYVSCLM